MSVSKCPYSFKILTCGTILHFYVALHTLRERISPYRIDTGFDIIFFSPSFRVGSSSIVAASYYVARRLDGVRGAGCVGL